MTKQTLFTILAIVVSIVGPILTAEGYSGEVPVALVPICVGATALITLLIRWYRDNRPTLAEKWNL